MTTKKTLLSFFLLLISFNIYACGSSAKEIQYSFFGLVFTVIVCAILLPTAGLLSAKFITISKAVILSLISLFGMFVAVLFFIMGESIVSFIIATVIFSCSLFLPTACYFYYSLHAYDWESESHYKELMN